MLGSDFELSRRHLDLRQGRAVGAGRRRHADGEDRRDHRRRDQDAMSGDQRGRRPPRSRIRKRASELAEQMLALTRKAGADGAEVLVRDGTELAVKVRLGEPELVQEAGSRALGLRVLKDQPRARSPTRRICAPAALERFARETRRAGGAGRARRSAALPAREEMAREVPELDLWDEAVLSLDVAEGDPARARGRGGGARRSTSGSPTPRARSSGAPWARRRSRRRPGSRGGARHARVARGRADRATTRTARSATAPTGPRRASPAALADAGGGRASRRRAARSPSWARARSRPARRRWCSRPTRRAGCSASSPA